MRALRSFTVRPTLPPALAPLHALAMNLRWAWDEPTRDVFRWVDPDLWDATRHDPVRLLAAVAPERLVELAEDQAFLRFLTDATEGLERYLTGDRWFQDREASPLDRVAYFSPEFGLAEAVPQYSGGLGVLAGDHLKAASDLGVPLAGVGLLYRHGYFRQVQSPDGWQEERYPDLDPFAMALSPCDGKLVTVDLAGQPLHARLWLAEVGRVALYFLDADVDENPPAIRSVTDRLYGGDTEHRLRQEILLGIGGVRALRALGESPDVFHTNEGHAGFLGLERIRELISADGLALAEAVEAVRAASVFTTHTPVPAGIDRFPRQLMERYFTGWAKECGVSLDELMALGHRPTDAPDAPFNMAVMGLRLAGRSNGVSKLHGRVSREMFADLWPTVPAEEVPIGSVTNGVHAPTWTSPEMGDLLSRTVLPDWAEAPEERWARVDTMGDDELWRVLDQGRERLVAFARERLRSTHVERGGSASDVAWIDDALDPQVLTIGFARRFATYKRAALLLSQPDRLKRLLMNSRRPVQLVFAGKAHPADEAGKEVIRKVVAFGADPDVRHRWVFLPDYDISVARVLVQGSDVWLNTPLRPHEASGTSGMKAALNGALNCSISDGWWDEMFDGENGWAIASAEQVSDEARRDQIEANALFDLLETRVVPLFYDRIGGRVPRRWTARVRRSLRTLGPQVLAARMVRDYVTGVYEPAAAEGSRLAADDWAPARALAGWKARVREAWEGVSVGAVTAEDDELTLGGERVVRAEVRLGSLSPTDVDVQLLHGSVGPDGELDAPATVPMAIEGEGSTWTGTFRGDRAGRYGFTVRVLPRHPDLADPLSLGLVCTA